ncbi:TonB C-terminal domain-containing protein [Sulfurimonas sp.]|uniref:TonB C-terminal domain-containing protein n=1 Tax=Sulfurimonas sp. TaxID=2022749 RepID=UPI002615933B|nr:TonB C-terminal domain-containing protein [Sulfurimonas sp.]
MSLFIFFLFVFVVMLFQVKDIKTYGFKKKNYISVSIALSPTKNIVNKTKSSVKKIATTTSSPSENIDVNNLFSDVWTKKIQHKVKKRKVNSKRISEIQKQIKLKENNQLKPIEKRVEQLEEKEEKESVDATSAANEVNEYLAKIQAIVYAHFNVPPNTEGNRVKIVIVLDPFGKMLDFRVLNYSASKALNSEVDRIKERLTNVVFPINPSGKTTTTTVTLISKE